MNLTKEQICEFETNGFLIIKNFADKNSCDEILRKAQKHLEEKVAPFESENEYLQKTNKNSCIRRLRQVYQRENVFKNWMENKKIRLILKTLLKDTPVLTLAHHNSIMTKLPELSSRTSWHQDIRYWNFSNDNLISVWLCLDEEYLENGLLEFIPKSHKLSLKKEQFDNKSNFLENNEENQELIKTRVHSNLSKGDIVLFHCKTLHHANKNTSLKTKISFVYTVRALNNKAIKNTRSDASEIVLS